MTEKSKAIYYLIVGLTKWEKEKGKIPEEIGIGHNMLIKELANSGTVPPPDLPSLIKMLKKPSGDWGLAKLNEIFPHDASIIDDVFGVTIEAEDFLEDYISPDENEQSIVRRLLLYCRKYDLDEEYREIRTFLSKPSHAVLSSLTLWEFKGSFIDKKLSGLIEECYEEIDSIDQYRVCPNCGWTLEWHRGNWRCNKENICHQVSDFTQESEFEATNLQLLRMKSGVQKYTLLPGIAEMKIASKLKEKGYDIVLYPEVDKFDIRILNNENEINLDVKDYRDPFQLAQSIKRKKHLEENESNWFVVPSYRAKLYPHYAKRVLSYLKDNQYEHVNVFMENEVYKKIGGVFHEKIDS